MPRKTLLFIFLYLFIVYAGPGLAATANRFGEVYDLEGAVKVISSDGRTTTLKPGRDLFYPIKEGDRIEVQQGKAVIVSVAQKGYEITANSVGAVRNGTMVTLKGTVAAKDGLRPPSGGTAGAIGGTVIRGQDKSAGSGGNEEGPSETIHKGQSIITGVEGQACMSNDKSRKQTEQAAMNDARREAAELALAYLKSETQVKDFELEKNLQYAYSNGQIQVIEQIESSWYKDASDVDCYKARLTMEIIPDEKYMKAFSRESALQEPNAPLTVAVWTDKREYKKGEKVRIYAKSNKPFYGRVIYRDAGGATLQLLPNPDRKESYFNGRVVHEIPSGKDQFDLEVTPPLGEENVIVYASTTPLGEIELDTQGAVYQVKTQIRNIGRQMRNVQLPEPTVPGKPTSVEFFEDGVVVKTEK